MNINTIIWEVLIAKLVNDNLPTFHYKNLIKYLVFLLLAIATLVLLLKLKISIGREAQKNTQFALIVVALTFILTQAFYLYKKIIFYLLW